MKRPLLHNSLNIITVILLCLVLDGPFSTSASEPVSIRLLSLQTPPYGYYEKDDTPKGYVYELNELILKHLSPTTAAHSMAPLTRVIRNLTNDEADCAILASTEYVRTHFKLVAPLGWDLSIGVLPRDGVILTQYDDLYRYSIGVPIGAKLSHAFDQDTEIKKVQVTGYHQGVQMLAHRRIEAMAGALESIYYLISSNPETANTTLGKPLMLDRVEFYFTCRKDFSNEALLARIKEVIAKLKQTGAIDSIIRPYVKK